MYSSFYAPSTIPSSASYLHPHHHASQYSNADDDDTTGGNDGIVTSAASGTVADETIRLPKRKRGTGMAFLKHQLRRQDQGGSLSAAAKELLSDLLIDHNLLPHKQQQPTASISGGINSSCGPSQDEEDDDDYFEHNLRSDPVYSPFLFPPASKKQKIRKPIEASMCSDERIMQLAQEGELSFLASLLKVIEEEQPGSVTTKFLIKACCLSVEPARVPALCDAKEMVMAGLHFLSRPFTPTAKNEEDDDDNDGDDHADKASRGDTIYPKLPLIRPISQTSDLERRVYEKCGGGGDDDGDWNLADILPQVLALEEVFYNSCWSSKWLAREHACPILPTGRDLLLLKGSPPAFCTAKTKKGGAANGGGGTGSMVSSFTIGGGNSNNTPASASNGGRAKTGKGGRRKGTGTTRKKAGGGASSSRSSADAAALAMEEEARRIMNATLSSDGGSNRGGEDPGTDDNEMF